MNKCVENYRKRRQKGAVIKIDLEKAYGKTDRNVLDYIMARKKSAPNSDLGCLDIFLLLTFDYIERHP